MYPLNPFPTKKIKALVHVKVTLFGNWVFADVIKLRYSHTEVGRVLIPMSCP